MRKLRVLVVDDSALFLGAARNVLSGLPQVACAEYVKSGAEALAKIAEFRPDLMLIDIMMTGMSGFEVLRAVRAGASAPVMYAITMHDSEDFLALAMKSGAAGLIPKRDFAGKTIALVAQLAEQDVATPVLKSARAV